MALFFVIDEHTDVTEDEGVKKLREIVMDALRNPDKARPDGEHVLGAMSKECVDDALQVS